MAKYAESAPIILKALEDGDTQKAAAEKAGISKETFHAWMKEKSDFSDAVQRAKDVARINSVAAVERSLMRLALGEEYEEVRTEYESKLNPATGKYEPTIKKQVRTKKILIPQTDAIKFFLTNKASEQWRNRQEHDIPNLELLANLHVQRADGQAGTSGLISHSEDEIPD